MITPIPIDQIAYDKITSSIFEVNSFPTVSLPDIAPSITGDIISKANLPIDMKPTININKILVGIVVLAAVGALVYFIHKYQKEQRGKGHRLNA